MVHFMLGSWWKTRRQHFIFWQYFQCLIGMPEKDFFCFDLYFVCHFSIQRFAFYALTVSSIKKNLLFSKISKPPSAFCFCAHVFWDEFSYWDDIIFSKQETFSRALGYTHFKQFTTPLSLLPCHPVSSTVCSVKFSDLWGNYLQADIRFERLF